MFYNYLKTISFLNLANNASSDKYVVLSGSCKPKYLFAKGNINTWLGVCFVST